MAQWETITIQTNNTYIIMKILNQVTLQHAIEWNESSEGFCYICDTFNLYAHMTNTIALIEAYMIHLLNFDYAY